MHQRNFTLDEIQNVILSPGDIYWIKKSGNKILVSRKGDECNLELINKLFLNHQDVFIENEIDKNLIYEGTELLNQYSILIHAKDQIEKRAVVFKYLIDNFVKKESSLFEFNYITWKWFSDINENQARIYLKYDREWFIRTMGLAGIGTLVAWTSGILDIRFLKSQYRNIIETSFTVLDSKTPIQAKEQIQVYLNSDLSFPFEATIDGRMTIFEKPNGSGPLKFKRSEMNELEHSLSLLNQSIKVFDLENETNFLKMLLDGELEVSPRIKNDLFKKFEIGNVG